MATTLAEICGILDDVSLKYMADEASDSIILGFTLDAERTTYRDKDGDPHVAIVIAIAERGDFIGLFAPFAWSLAGCGHKAAVFEAITLIQSHFKLLRFDYDPNDGEIRPNVELPLEDASVTPQQFQRVMRALIEGINRFDQVIRHAMNTGEVRLDLAHNPLQGQSDPADIDSLLQLIDRTGGIDALEDLAGGGSLPNDTPDEGERWAG